MYIPDQQFSDKETLREVLEEFSELSARITGLYEELVQKSNEEMNKNEDIDIAVVGMDDQQRINLYEELLHDYAIPLLMKRYNSFEISGYKLFGIKGTTKELLSWIDT